MLIVKRMLLVPLACIGCSHIVEPNPSALHNVIAYEAPNQYGTRSVWVMNPDGTGQRQLPLPAAGAVDNPDISPDGTEVVVEFAYNLYLAGVDGSNWRPLFMDPTPDEDPVWSPDGTRIAFISFRDLDWELYVVNADGSNPVRLTQSGGVHEGHPSWSPDGGWLVYSASTDSFTHLYKVRVDGGVPHQLTSGDVHDGQPDWSPDGLAIAFVSGGREPFGTVFSVSASGGAPTVNVPGDSLASSHDPDWSPDGASLIFYRAGSGIWRSDLDGSPPVLIADGLIVPRPQWVP